MESDQPNRKESRLRSKHLDEVTWTNVDAEDDAGLTLAPVDPEVEEHRARQRANALPREPVFDTEEDEFKFIQPRFTLKQMVIAQGVIAVLLALVRIFTPSLTAGSLGIAAMVLAAAISIYEPEDKRVTIGFWCLFGLYLMSCVVAMVMGSM